jgi:hypothetical protein
VAVEGPCATMRSCGVSESIRLNSVRKLLRAGGLGVGVEELSQTKTLAGNCWDGPTGKQYKQHKPENQTKTHLQHLGNTNPKGMLRIVFLVVLLRIIDDLLLEEQWCSSYNWMPWYWFGMVTPNKKQHIWIPNDSYGFLWIPIVSYGFLRIPIDSYGFLRIPWDS